MERRRIMEKTKAHVKLKVLSTLFGHASTWKVLPSERVLIASESEDSLGWTFLRDSNDMFRRK